MIDRLRISNFQRHRKLDLSLGRGVTTIVGPSDRGKSAILRAIRWAVENKPGGSAFIRHGRKSVKVELSVDGHRVTRSRGKGGNLYKLDGKVYKAFGHDVPDDIAKLLNMREVNFQTQYDSPFWLMESAGQVSKRLNAIVNLSLMDAVLSHLEAKRRKAADRLEVSEDLYRTSKRELKRLGFVPGMVEEFKSIVGQRNMWLLACGSRDELVKAVSTAKEAKEALREPPPDISPLLALARRLKGLLEQEEKLSGAIRTAKEQVLRRKQLKQEYLQAERHLRTHVRGKACPVCGKEMT